MNFSRLPVHAATYTDYASVQHRARDWLWSGWPERSGLVLDVGSGPVAGPPQPRPELAIVALDSSLAMLTQLPSSTDRLAADGCALPLATESVQAVASSMAMQWIGVSGLREWSRVLVPGGQMGLVVPLVGSLAGLSAQLRSAGAALRAPRLLDEWAWFAGARAAGCWVTAVEIETIRIAYTDRQALVRALTRIGASGEGSDQPRAVRRAVIRQLDQWCASGEAALEYVLLRLVGEKRCGTS